LFIDFSFKKRYSTAILYIVRFTKGKTLSDRLNGRTTVSGTVYLGSSPGYNSSMVKEKNKKIVPS
jgi:hypothetical protein